MVCLRVVVSPQPALTSWEDIGRRSALWWLAGAIALGAAFRFYGLAWGAPYFHFHIDEHLVFTDAYLLARDPHQAALSSKFFIYSPFPMYVLNVLVDVYEVFAHPLNLRLPGDEVTYMVLGRAISATLGTATIALVYVIARHLAGRLAGVLAAFLLACSVIHLRDSHFFSMDVSMTFFTVVTWYFLTRTVERGDLAGDAGSAIGLALGLASKYAAAFLAPLIGIARLLSPNGPRGLRPMGTWVREALRAAVLVALGIGIFLVIDPLVVQYWEKFQSDIKSMVIDPLRGGSKPEWIAQFADVNALPYWFTNLLWWGLGPALEVWSLAGLVWLVIRRDRLSLLAAAFPVVYWLSAGRTATIAPFIRYTVPLAPPLAVAAAVLSADLIRRPRWRSVGIAATSLVLATTILWAAAYMNVFRSPDSRLEASKWITENVPAESKILIEPSHNIPPMGSYLTSVDFHQNYVLFYPATEKHDYYRLYAFDTYRTLYNPWSDENRRKYIASRLALADWIVMDDTFLTQYQHLSEATHAATKQHYRDLFAGKLGFQLVKTFKVYPSLFGWTINDDDAELTFRLFDHPRIFIFRRQT